MPPKARKQAVKKVEKKVANVLANKLARKVRASVPGKVVVTGNGDYVPSRFMRVKGRGGYFSNLGSGLGGLFGGAGGKVGGAVGGIVDAGKSIFDLITGSGDYRARARAANMTHAANGGVTNLGSLNMGAMNVEFGNTGPPRVRHREFIGTVLGSVAFATTTYRIQPGLRGASVLFPWGSSVANCFEQYVLRGMILEYKTRSTNYSASVELGTVMMSTVYDSEASPLASQIAIDNHEFTTADTPDKTFIHPIECASAESPTTVRYVQASNTSGGTDDERFNDVGIFQISTIGMPSSADGVVVGELWASYDIEFLKPALPDIHAGTAFLMSSTQTASGSSVFQTSETTTCLYDQQSSYPVTSSGPYTLQLPIGYAGTYLLSWTAGYNAATGATDFVPPYPMSWGTDITPVNGFPDASGGTPLNSADVFAYPGSVGGSTIANFRDVTNSTIGWGVSGQFLFSTIGETLLNNTITFFPPNWGSSTTVTQSSYGILLTAVDSDLPSGQNGPSGVQPAAFVDKRKQRRLLNAGVAKLTQLADTNAALLRRLSALENVISVRSQEECKDDGGASTSAPRPACLYSASVLRAVSDGELVSTSGTPDLSESYVAAKSSIRNAAADDLAAALKRVAIGPRS
jgi:hypothetical protein